MKEVFALLLGNAGMLADGLLITLTVSVAAIGLGLLLGALLAAGCGEGLSLLRLPSRFFIEIMRALPFMLVLLLVHFGTQTFIGRTAGTITGTAALGLYGSAYFAEALRTARAAVPVGQQEAAFALGLRPHAVFLKVVAPQMIVIFAAIARVVAINLLKESAVLSIITVPELTHSAMRIQSVSFATVPTFVLLTFLYWAVISLVSSAIGRIERCLSPKSRQAMAAGPQTPTKCRQGGFMPRAVACFSSRKV